MGQVMTGLSCRSDLLLFMRSWINNPLRVAAVAPSSDALSNLITRNIDPSSGLILELGAGTGVFTRALIEKGIPEHKLTLIEHGSDFMRLLQLRFPYARVLWMDASQLGANEIYPGPVVGAVVSGLPLLAMPARKQLAVLSGAFRYIRPGGAFYQFTYGARCPVPRPILDRMQLKAARIGGTMLNVPPASVYRITRRAPFRMNGSFAATE
jgi:phosphatidylethanolamine/phosphatidyl-N-methylethanolamine N-methyltransferase